MCNSPLLTSKKNVGQRSLSGHGPHERWWSRALVSSPQLWCWLTLNRSSPWRNWCSLVRRWHSGRVCSIVWRGSEQTRWNPARVCYPRLGNGIETAHRPAAELAERPSWMLPGVGKQLQITKLTIFNIKNINFQYQVCWYPVDKLQFMEWLVNSQIHIMKYLMWKHTVNWYMRSTHWGRDKLANIFQMKFLNIFSWMKMHEFD